MGNISAAPTRLQNNRVSSQQMHSRRETSDDYDDVVLLLAPRWRVIKCRKAIQWIIQHKEASHAGPWRGVSYHTCRDGLRRSCGSLGLLSGTLADQLLDALPSSIREYANERSHS